MNSTVQAFGRRNRGLGWYWPPVLYLLLVAVLALASQWLPLGYSPNAIDLDHVYQPPLQWRSYISGQPFHWLGTDQLGRDLLANLIYGARTALLVSVPAILLAAVIGVGLGLLAGYFGDQGLSLPAGKAVAAGLALLFFCFYAFRVNAGFISGTGAVILFNLSLPVLSYMVYRLLVLGLIKISLFRSSIRLPLDLTLMKIIELLGAVPRLLLILCLAAFLRPSVSMVVLLAMLTYWPAIARLTRAEILKIRTVPYVEAAVALGYHPGRILLRHALPNISVPLLVAIAFGLTNLIALEATLSFLGIGLPPEMPSWGRIISSARSNFAAWWLIVFPGMVITLTVISIQNVNNLILNCLNPK